MLAVPYSKLYSRRLVCVSVPAQVANLRVISVGMDYITLGWEPPPPEPGVHIQTYEVRYYVGESVENASRLETGNRHNLTLSNLLPQTEYSFQVRTSSTMAVSLVSLHR